MTWAVHCADVLAWCEDYAAKIERGEELPFHGILCDPSYGLGDNPDIEALLTAWMSGEDYDMGPGFMSRNWDQLPSPRYWAALRHVCHPGAYLFAFGGTRTADLLSIAIRLGGWERFDEIDVLGGSVSWIQGAGFPKSLNLGKSIDSAAGMEREVVRQKIRLGDKKPYPTNENRNNHSGYSFGADGTTYETKGEITAPATPLATTWSQHGTATKPSHEPVLCFRNPLAKVPSDRIHAVTGWDWWHSEKSLKDTPHTRLKMFKKYGCRLPPLYGDSDLVLITRKALHEDVETDKLFVARAKRQWCEAPTEPVTLARVDVKAYQRWSSETYAANCLSTGVGALWIEGSRVATGEDLRGGQYSGKERSNGACYGKHHNLSPEDYRQPAGRWPPNCVLVHVPPRPDGNGGWLPGCERLGVKRVRASGYFPAERTPNQIYGGGKGTNIETGFDGTNPHADLDGLEPVTAYACVLACDGCGHQWIAEQRGACPECGREARWACAVGALSEQSGDRRSAYINEKTASKNHKNEAQATWGTYGSESGLSYSDKGTCTRFFPQFTWQHEIAERLAGVTPFRYVSKAGRAQRDAGLDGFERQANDFQRETSGLNQDRPNREGRKPAIPPRNPHPTVKNIELTQWLATLLLPPPEYAPRRVLCPFAGSGSEMIGCLLAGFDEVIGIEREPDYVDISRARLRFWADWAARGYDEPAVILKAAKKEETRQEKEQMEMSL